MKWFSLSLFSFFFFLRKEQSSSDYSNIFILNIIIPTAKKEQMEFLLMTVKQFSTLIAWVNTEFLSFNDIGKLGSLFKTEVFHDVCKAECLKLSIQLQRREGFWNLVCDYKHFSIGWSIITHRLPSKIDH